MCVEEYINTEEAAKRLGLDRKSVRNKKALGIFKKGIHYFKPKGLGTRYKWSALVAWMEGKEKQPTQDDKKCIPMAKGYSLGHPLDCGK